MSTKTTVYSTKGVLMHADAQQLAPLFAPWALALVVATARTISAHIRYTGATGFAGFVAPGSPADTGGRNTLATCVCTSNRPDNIYVKRLQGVPIAGTLDAPGGIVHEGAAAKIAYYGGSLTASRDKRGNGCMRLRVLPTSDATPDAVAADVAAALARLGVDAPYFQQVAASLEVTALEGALQVEPAARSVEAAVAQIDDEASGFDDAPGLAALDAAAVADREAREAAEAQHEAAQAATKPMPSRRKRGKGKK